MMTEAAKPVWAGFWRRLIAFLVDALVLGALGLAAGALLFEQLAALPGPTRLIGGAVGLLYFGLLSSGAGGSATLGMRLLGLRVTSMRGRPLNLPTALWRALLLQAPLTLNGLTLQPSDEPLFNQVFFVVAATLVFGVILAQIVLLIFNAPSRRLVHDLLSGSAVVRRRHEGPLPKHGSVAQAIALLLVLAALGGSTYFALVYAPQAAAPETLEPLLVTQKAVLALPEVMEASVNDNTHTLTSNGTTTVTRTLIVTARLNAWPKDERKAADRIAETVMKVHDFAPGQRLQVTLRHGYDIGISGFWRSYWNTYPTEAPVAEPVPAAAEPAAPTTPAAAPAAPKPARKPKAEPQPAPVQPEPPEETPGATVLAAA